MAGRGRFGKYGDLKRKEKLRKNRLLFSVQARSLYGSGKAAADRHTHKGENNK
ncbi:MAG: hypothetical protein HPY84_00130 [Syntrophobacteraceae bacterium]|jgi:hypothetical protein|nr:hypothetical protein [Syntrophobacteraceae bacterium]